MSNYFKSEFGEQPTDPVREWINRVNKLYKETKLNMETEQSSEDLNEVLAPDAHASLNSAKMFIARAVEAMLKNSRFEQAKRAIDILQNVEMLIQDRALTPMAISDSRFTPSEIQLIIKGSKIEAIKNVRTRTGMGLKEAKDLVESYKG